MRKQTAYRGVTLGTLLLLATTTAVHAQIESVWQAQQQNAQGLRQYAWKSRTELRKGGETKNVQLALMRYDNNGTLQKTPISNSAQQQLPTRGLRGLIAQKKKENFMDTIESLGRLAKAYGELQPDAMQRLIAGANVTPENGPREKLVRVTGVNVLQQGDSMTLWLDAVSRKQRRVEIQTTMDHRPVRIVSEFEDLPGGPSYVARSVIDYASDEITMIIDNFDYQRVAR